jgi:hypothetical protein
MGQLLPHLLPRPPPGRDALLQGLLGPAAFSGILRLPAEGAKGYPEPGGRGPEPAGLPWAAEAEIWSPYAPALVLGQPGAYLCTMAGFYTASGTDQAEGPTGLPLRHLDARCPRITGERNITLPQT